MTKEELILEATQELKTIKGKATAEEIAKLDWDNFHPLQIGQCFYGQLTGTFRSNRAKEICPKKYGFQGNISVKYEFVDNQVVSTDNSPRLTALELYLYYFNDGKGGKIPEHKRIFDYLKGVTKEVDLTIK